jgi:SAM-dependent methyltransferase
MIESEKYTENFFDELEANSHKSAKVVLPILFQVIEPKSVIDIGCGTGTWLKVCDEMLGVKDYLGIEGPYVKPQMLKIPIEKVQFKDLKDAFDPGRKFDLAMSLEVAEHLPTDYSRQFIQRLTDLSDLILFSAAIPQQEGTYHINEQYPEFWAKYFEEFGFVPVDYIRPRIWNHPEVEYWYQQNIILYVKKSIINTYPELANIAKYTSSNYLTRIHPFLYELKTRHIRNTKNIFGYLNWKWYVFKTQFIKGKAK